MSTNTVGWPTEGATARLTLRDAGKRKDWTRRLADMARAAESADPAVIGPVVVDARREFTAGVQQAKAELLGNPLCWDAEEREIAQWLAEGYGVLARAGTRIAERMAAACAGAGRSRPGGGRRHHPREPRQRAEMARDRGHARPGIARAHPRAVPPRRALRRRTRADGRDA